MSEPVLLMRARRLRAARGVVVARDVALAGTVIVTSWRDCLAGQRLTQV